MSVSNILINKLVRAGLEKMASEAICPCWFYDLVDNIETTSNTELLEIIEGNFYCSLCDGGDDNE